MSSTKCLGRLVGNPDAKSLFPPVFLKSIQRALDAGLTCEQISAILMLAASVVELEGCFGGRGLQERVERIIGEMKGFPGDPPEDAKVEWFTGREEG